MTEQEAIAIIKYYYPTKKILDCGDFVEVNDRDCRLGCALDKAIHALYEIKQYREIGTIEECLEAVEKQKPKKSILRNDNGKLRKSCPVCGCFFSPLSRSCPKCGQDIDENLEEMEDE